MWIITAPKDKAFSLQRITLEGLEYQLSLDWNMRGGWYIGMYDEKGTPIFSPKKLVPDWDLLESVTDPKRPRGALVLVDMSGQGRKPDRDSIGSTHKIVYVDSDEIIR